MAAAPVSGGGERREKLMEAMRDEGAAVVVTAMVVATCEGGEGEGADGDGGDGPTTAAVGALQPIGR